MATQHTSTRVQMVRMSDGAEIFTKILGNHPGKKLFIACHGGPGASSHKDTERAFAFLQTRFRVLFYDARGDGFSEKKGPFTRQRWVADLDELRSWAGADKFVLAGGSYGGVIALDYALAHGDRLAALIVYDTFADGKKAKEDTLNTILTSDRVSVDKDRQTRLWTGRLRDNEDEASAFSEILPLLTAESAREAPSLSGTEFNFEVSNSALGSDLDSFNVTSTLGSINVPTLVAVGQKDLICPVSYSEVINRGISGSKLAIFKESCHSPPREEPEAWRSCIVEFVDAL